MAEVEALVSFLARQLVQRPEDVRVHRVEGAAVVMVELSVHPSDRSRIIGHKGRTIKALRQLLSAASGRRKAVLELVELDGESAGED